jgi:branched-chain amino acid transport system permease protein
VLADHDDPVVSEIAALVLALAVRGPGVDLWLDRTEARAPEPDSAAARLFASERLAIVLGDRVTLGRLGASLRVTGGIALGWFPLTIFVLAVAILVGLQLFFDRTMFGRALRATSDDPEAAQLMTINDRHMYAVAMGIALAIAGVAGVFVGVRTTFSPFDGSVLLIFAFEAVIIGGLGSLWGTLVGGVILGVAQTLGAHVSPSWFQLTGHLVFLAVLAVRPTGLFARQGGLR